MLCLDTFDLTLLLSCQHDPASWHQPIKLMGGRYNFVDGSSDSLIGYPLALRPDAGADSLSHPNRNKWGADLHSSLPPPLFSVALLVSEDGLAFDPALSTLSERVLKTFDSFIESVAGIDDVHAKVKDYQSERALPSVTQTEPLVQVGGEGRCLGGCFDPDCPQSCCTSA